MPQKPPLQPAKYEFTDKSVAPHRHHPFLRYIGLEEIADGYRITVKPRFDPDYAESRHLKEMAYEDFIQRFATAAVMSRQVKMDRVSVSTHIDAESREGHKNKNKVIYELHEKSQFLAGLLMQSLLVRLQQAEIVTEKQALSACDAFGIQHRDYHVMAGLVKASMVDKVSRKKGSGPPRR